MTVDAAWWIRVRSAVARLRAAAGRGADERAMAAEMEFHVDMQTRANMRGGMSADEARRAALVSFGGRERWKEEAREESRPVRVEQVARDVRYALRALRRNAAFAGVSVAILAIGIGASTTVFGLVDALLLQPLPADSPGELFEAWNANPRASSDFERYMPLSYPEYVHFRDHRGAFADMLAFDGDPAFLSWKRGRGGELVQAQFVSTNFFSLLRVKPATGRTFLPSDDQPSGEQLVAVVSDAFWRGRLGADGDLARIPFVVNGQPFTIVGVAPRGFAGLVAGMAPDVWLPLPTVERVKHGGGVLASRSSFWLLAVGRLEPGASAEQAGAELAVEERQFAQGDPELKDLVAVLFPATLVPAPFRGYVAVFVGLLQALVVLMLMIACANAANLALAQAASRRPEMAIRASLGASRGRLVQQMLTEALILAVVAGAGGLVAARVVAPALLHLVPRTLPFRLSLSTDWRVVLFAAMLALVSGVALGWAPALGATSDLYVRRGGDSGGRRRSRLRNTLVVVQVAVSLVLLVAGALCWRSLVRAHSVDPGFETDHRVFVKLDLKTLGYADSAGRAFFRTLLSRESTAPGVISASTASYLPLETTSLTVDVEIPGRLPPRGQRGFSVQAIDVGPAFFTTAGTGVVRGREFDVHDGPGASSVAIVNEAMAERFWPGENVVGHTVYVGAGSDRTGFRIVGVVRTGKYRTLGEPPRTVLFRSLLQHYQPRAALLVHTSRPAGAALEAVRDDIARIDPNLVVIQANSLDEQLALSLFPTRVTGILFGVIGVTGLCLALAGLAGLVAYSVASRTKEIGIRMALGAGPGDVLAQFVGEGARLLLIGAGIGSAAALAVTRVLTSVLFGTTPTDPLAFLGVIVLLMTSALGACWFAARRAATIDPMTALRRD